MSRRQNNIQYVQEEPDFLRRMREGFTAEDNNKAAEKRRRRGSEVIDEDEAPQVVIQGKDQDKIDADEARKFVQKKAGVTVQAPNVQATNAEAKATTPAKAKVENVSLGMMKKRKNESVIKVVEEKEERKEKSEKNGVEKKAKAGQRKEKRLKLSFEED